MKFDDLFKLVMEDLEPITSNAPEVTHSPTNNEPVFPTEEKPENEQLYDKLKEFLSKGARFASFIYKTNGTMTTDQIRKGAEPNGPTKIYKVNLGINYGNIKDHNKAVIEAYTPEDKWEELAKAEMLSGLTKPFNPDEDKPSVYVNIGKGMRYNTEKDCINIMGQVTGKAEIVAPGEEKPKSDPYALSVNKDGSPRGGDKAHIARAKRIIQHKLKEQLRGGLTSYDLSTHKIGGVKLNGDVIEFHSENKEPLNN